MIDGILGLDVGGVILFSQVRTWRRGEREGRTILDTECGFAGKLNGEIADCGD